MDYERLKAETYIDTETEACFLLITSIKEAASSPHCHEFAEIMLILEGKAIHVINGRRQLLSSGMLILIRPDDVHTFEKLDNNDFKFINLAFPLYTLKELSMYLGEGFPVSALMEAGTPPGTKLTEVEKNILKQKFEKLNIIPVGKKTAVKAELRALLVNILTSYFSAAVESIPHGIPVWFQELCTAMNSKPCFTKGVSEMQRLSGKSHEHLCRLFRKYFNQTPTDYVNELRLNYAANLLGNTDYPILDICAETGFESLSYFYGLFKNKFGITPAHFRNNNNKGGLVV